MMQFGVPQGSFLGSTLFISHNSSLPSSTRCDLVEVDQFSDDTASSSFQLDAAPARPDIPPAVNALSTWAALAEAAFYSEPCET